LHYRLPHSFPTRRSSDLYYLEKKKERDARNQAAWSGGLKVTAPKAESDSTPKQTRPRKRTFKEQRELEGMEASILAAEGRVKELDRKSTRLNSSHGSSSY